MSSAYPTIRDKPPGSNKGTSRVDLRTVEKDKIRGAHVTYNFKTGKAPVNDREVAHHQKNLPHDYLLKLRAGELGPEEVYNPKQSK